MFNSHIFPFIKPLLVNAPFGGKPAKDSRAFPQLNVHLIDDLCNMVIDYCQVELEECERYGDGEFIKSYCIFGKCVFEVTLQNFYIEPCYLDEEDLLKRPLDKHEDEKYDDTRCCREYRGYDTNQYMDINYISQNDHTVIEIFTRHTDLYVTTRRDTGVQTVFFVKENKKIIDKRDMGLSKIISWTPDKNEIHRASKQIETFKYNDYNFENVKVKITNKGFSHDGILSLPVTKEYHLDITNKKLLPYCDAKCFIGETCKTSLTVGSPYHCYDSDIERFNWMCRRYSV